MLKLTSGSTSGCLSADTSNIRLSLLSSADKTLYCAIFTNNACMQYVRPVLTVSEAEYSFSRALQWNQRTPLKHLYFKVSLAVSANDIGIASANHIDLSTKTADLGRMLLPCWHNLGLGTELTIQLMKWLKVNLGIINFTKSIHPENLSAITSAKRNGFTEITSNVNNAEMLIRVFTCTIL